MGRLTERIKGAVSRFDVILCFALAFAVFAVLLNEWNIVHGYAQFISSVWTFLGLIFGGEIITFSLYQIAKKVTGAKVPDTFKAKHGYVRDMENENGGMK